MLIPCSLTFIGVSMYIRNVKIALPFQWYQYIRTGLTSLLLCGYLYCLETDMVLVVKIMYMPMKFEKF